MIGAEFAGGWPVPRMESLEGWERDPLERYTPDDHE
jgi:hypothetical protein